MRWRNSRVRPPGPRRGSAPARREVRAARKSRCPRAPRRSTAPRRPGRRAGSRPQVHDLYRGRELRGQRGGLCVRHRHEDKVGPGERGGIRGSERPVREPDEVRVHGRDRGPGVRPGRHRADLQVRVAGPGGGAVRRPRTRWRLLLRPVRPSRAFLLLRRWRAVGDIRAATPATERLCSVPRTYAREFVLIPAKWRARAATGERFVCSGALPRPGCMRRCLCIRTDMLRGRTDVDGEAAVTGDGKQRRPGEATENRGSPGETGERRARVRQENRGSPGETGERRARGQRGGGLGVRRERGIMEASGPGMTARGWNLAGAQPGPRMM